MSLGKNQYRSVRYRGFTLMEVLVVMALLSVVMLALGVALRNVAQSESRIDERLVRMDEYRVATALIRSTLGRISARKVSVQVPAGASPFLFAAAPDAIAWVGVMPARYGAGGRTFFRLEVERLEDGDALVVRYQPWADVAAFPNWMQSEFRVLMRGVSAISVRYENVHQIPSAWTVDWPHIQFLPARIGIRLRTDRGELSELIVPLQVLPASDDLRQGDETVIGGTPVL